MDNGVLVQTEEWKNTKEAVSNFRRLLLCSKCSMLMKDPVCLGMCEHMLCRSCAGTQAGDGCVVCHSPAWVKDIQINRQLSSIIELFSGLESLFKPIEQPDSSLDEIQTQPESTVFREKKSFKIWFSPRSRKVRCMVEKPSEVTIPECRSSGEMAAAQPDSITAQSQDLSVFNFTSSSQDSGSSSTQRCRNESKNMKKRSAKKNAASRKVPVQGATRNARKQTNQMMKKNRLETINQQWGITEEVDPLKEKEQPCAERARRSSKSVSFLSPPVTSHECQPEVPKGGTTKKCRNESKNMKKNVTSKKVPVQGATRKARKQTNQMMVKNRLETINQQWGITEEVDPLKEKEQPYAEGARRSSKTVSFLSPPLTSDERQPEVPQGGTNELSPSKSPMRESPSRGRAMSDSVIQQDKLSTNDTNPTDNPEKQDNVSIPKHSSKRSRAEEKVAPLETTPKRPRASPGRRRKSQMSPAVLNPPSLCSPRCEKSIKKSRQEQGDSPSALNTAGRKSPCGHGASAGRPTSGSPAVMKRNHKGETLLHLAAIKGDVEAVKELLDQGADPNLRDNAGWTPLHEACNLGHLAAVEVLVSKGALLNTPGYENDSPLHDAVRNGHLAIVKLLLQLGASQSVLNLFGKRPTDYAVSLEMQEIFQKASEGTKNANAYLSPSASLSMVSDCVRKDEMVVFLASKLSQLEQHCLAKLGELLGGTMTETFSGSVSHVVLPEGHMPTTYSTLLGLLAGCWVVKFSWVEACLQAGEWMPETEHEAGEGPQRSRINRCSLLPPLFDGCFFFLLGSFKAPSKDELTKLLREGGGQFLSRQPKPESDVTQTLSAAAYHALPGSDQALCTQYIIFDPQGPHKPAVVRRGKVWSAPSSWVIDCIAAFCLLPVPDPQASV